MEEIVCPACGARFFTAAPHCLSPSACRCAHCGAQLIADAAPPRPERAGASPDDDEAGGRPPRVAPPSE